MRFLDSFNGRGRLASGLGSELLPRGLAFQLIYERFAWYGPGGTMRFLDSSSGRGRLAGGLGSELLPRSLASR